MIAYHCDDQTGWDVNLYWLQMAFNFARHESHKYTPYSLMFTFPPNNPLSNLWSIKELLPDSDKHVNVKDLWKRVAANLKVSHGKVLQRYNQNRRPVPFSEGDLVLVKTFPQSKAVNKFSAKLSRRFEGPYKIVRFSSPVTVHLEHCETGNYKRAHVSFLKMWKKE